MLSFGGKCRGRDNCGTDCWRKFWYSLFPLDRGIRGGIKFSPHSNLLFKKKECRERRYV